jgi:hypothetical protein
LDRHGARAEGENERFGLKNGLSIRNFLWNQPFGDLAPHFDFAFWTKGEVRKGAANR